MNLFSLTEEYKNIMELAEDPEVDPEIIATQLEVIEMDIKDKADSIAYIIAQLDGDVATIKMWKRSSGKKNASTRCGTA